MRDHGGMIQPSQAHPETEPVPRITASTAKRTNATVIGMLMATGVSLGIALLLPLLSPHRSGSLLRPTVDAAAVAGQAQPAAGFHPLAPLPEGWSVNYARWNAAGNDGVAYWEVGYTTAEQRFVVLIQTAQSNPTWLSNRTDGAAQTGVREIAGQSWTLRDKPGIVTALVGSLPESTVVLRAEAPRDAGQRESVLAFGALDALATATVRAAEAAAQVRSTSPGP